MKCTHTRDVCGSTYIHINAEMCVSVCVCACARSYLRTESAYSWPCGHPLVSGIPEDLTLGQRYLRESSENVCTASKMNGIRQRTVRHSKHLHLITETLSRTEEPILMNHSCSRAAPFTNSWRSLEAPGSRLWEKVCLQEVSVRVPDTHTYEGVKARESDWFICKGGLG